MLLLLLDKKQSSSFAGSSICSNLLDWRAHCAVEEIYKTEMCLTHWDVLKRPIKETSKRDPSKTSGRDLWKRPTKETIAKNPIKDTDARDLQNSTVLMHQAARGHEGRVYKKNAKETRIYEKGSSIETCTHHKETYTKDICGDRWQLNCKRSKRDV